MCKHKQTNFRKANWQFRSTFCYVPVCSGTRTKAPKQREFMRPTKEFSAVMFSMCYKTGRTNTHELCLHLCSSSSRNMNKQTIPVCERRSCVAPFSHCVCCSSRAQSTGLFWSQFKTAQNKPVRCPG